MCSPLRRGGGRGEVGPMVGEVSVKVVVMVVVLEMLEVLEPGHGVGSGGGVEGGGGSGGGVGRVEAWRWWR